jgi:translation initiation factor IF-3
MQFRGREQARPEIGYRILMKLAEELVEIAVIEFAPKQEGRNMTMVLAPLVKKGQAAKSVKAPKVDKPATAEAAKETAKEREVPAEVAVAIEAAE